MRSAGLGSADAWPTARARTGTGACLTMTLGPSAGEHGNTPPCCQGNCFCSSNRRRDSCALEEIVPVKNMRDLGVKFISDGRGWSR